MLKVGIGYDVHPLTPERKLVIGGVVIKNDKGLLGHSDADVLVHAVVDALLGAANLGDIGRLFPDSDPQYKNVSSLELLEKTGNLLTGEGFAVVNADAIIVAEKPKLEPYFKAMQVNMAKCLGVDPNCLHVKATTQEGLGFIGKGEGIGAMCVALISRVIRKT